MKPKKDQWPKPWRTSEPYDGCRSYLHIVDINGHVIFFTVDPDLAEEIVAAVNAAADLEDQEYGCDCYYESGPQRKG